MHQVLAHRLEVGHVPRMHETVHSMAMAGAGAKRAILSIMFPAPAPDLCGDIASGLESEQR
jgi:hypothetical protein